MEKWKDSRIFVELFDEERDNSRKFVTDMEGDALTPGQVIEKGLEERRKAEKGLKATRAIPSLPHNGGPVPPD